MEAKPAMECFKREENLKKKKKNGRYFFLLEMKIANSFYYVKQNRKSQSYN